MSTAVISPSFAGPQRRPRVRTAPVRQVRPAPAAAGAVRLTRRGRVVLTLVFLGLVLAVLTVFGSTSAATGEAGDPIPTRTVMVEPGDTLWGIASAVAAPGETREMVHRIQELNALPGAGLSAGQRIAVPVLD